MVSMKKKQQQGKAGKSPLAKSQPAPSPGKKPAAHLATADSEGTDSGDSDDGETMPTNPIVAPMPSKLKQTPVAKQQQLMDVDNESDEDDDDDDIDSESDEAPVAKQQTPVAKQNTPVAKKQTPVAKQQTPVAKQQTPVAKQQTPVAKQQTPAKKTEDDDEEDESEDDDDAEEENASDEGDSEEEPMPVAKQQKIKVPVGNKKQESDSEDEEEEDEDDDDDEEDDEDDEEEEQSPVAKKSASVAKQQEDDDEEDEEDEEDEDDEDSEEDDEEQQKKSSKPAAKSAAAINGAEVPVAKAAHYVLLGNLEANTNVSDLKNYLSKRGVAYVSAAVLDSPVAILGLSTAQDASAALAKCQGAAYKSRQLAACHLAGKPDRLLQQMGSSPLPGNTDNSTLFVSNLPAEINEASLISLAKSKLGGRADELISAQLLIKKGAPGNAHRGQAIVRLAGTAAAQTLLEGLSGHLLAGKPVKASYYVGNKEPQGDKKAKAADSAKQKPGKAAPPSQSANDSSTELRGQTRTLMLTNLPVEACSRESDSIKTAFPGGVRYAAKARPGQEFGACFVEFESADACAEAFDRFGQIGKMDGREIGVKFAPQRSSPGQQQNQQQGGNKQQSKTIGVFNLPFSVTTDSLREYFPECVDLFIPKAEDGRSRGFAIVRFDTEEAANKAMSEQASLSLEGRQVRLEYREDRPPNEGGARGGGRGGRQPVPSKEDLDAELDKYTAAAAAAE